MRTIRALALAITLMMLAVGAFAEAPVEVVGPGLSRAAAGRGCAQATDLDARYGVPVSDGVTLYAPADPQPLNAYMVTDPACQVGIDRDDMYLVSEKGLVPEISAYLAEWMGEIEAASGGLIRFVEDPDEADVLVIACQSYKYYGQYSGEGLSAEGYSCTVTFEARQLSNPAQRCTFTRTRTPEETVGLRGGGRFWKTPPELENTDELAAFAGQIAGWYGFGAQKGSRGDGVAELQQALADRGYLDDAADGDFGPRTEAALMRLQADYGLEQTGVADIQTTLAAYYDQASFDAAFALE